jgi:hypothetical protein
MLLLLTVLIEVCKHVYAELDEPQAYAIYRIGAVLSASQWRLQALLRLAAALGLQEDDPLEAEGRRAQGSASAQDSASIFAISDFGTASE